MFLAVDDSKRKQVEPQSHNQLRNHRNALGEIKADQVQKTIARREKENSLHCYIHLLRFSSNLVGPPGQGPRSKKDSCIRGDWSRMLEIQRHHVSWPMTIVLETDGNNDAPC
jgi:hypothetical protein